MWTPDIVIYHAPCDDGFGAALMAFRKWGIGLEYVGANYGDEPPNVEGKNVLILDFSYKADALAELGRKANSILILDHHVSAEQELEQYCIDSDRLNINTLGTGQEEAEAGFFMGPGDSGTNILAVFDMNRSGAGLAHDFLFPDEPRPAMVNYLEDRDLWRFQYPQTKPFTMYLRSIEFDFLTWCALLDQLDDYAHATAILERGRAIEAFFNKKIKEVAGEAFISRIYNHDVPVVNANWAFSSDVCHELLDRYPGAPFVGSFFIRKDGKVQWSLRSRDDRADVSEIAKELGGGGHRNASGFTEEDTSGLKFLWNGRIEDVDFQ